MNKKTGTAKYLADEIKEQMGKSSKLCTDLRTSNQPELASEFLGETRAYAKVLDMIRKRYGID